MLIVGEVTERDTGFYRVTDLFLEAFQDERPEVLNIRECFDEEYEAFGKRFKLTSRKDYRDAARRHKLIINLHDYASTKFITDTYPHKVICACPVDSVSHFPHSPKLYLPHTTHSRDYYLRYGVCSEIVRIPPRTIYGEDIALLEQDRQSARKCFNIGERDLCFLAVGDYGARKNYELLFDTFKYIEDERVKLIVVSRDFPDSVYQQIAIECNLAHRCYLFNVETTREMLHLLYLAADVYISTSHGEGVCLPFIDAIGYGLPCIVPDHTAFKDYAHFPEVYYSHGWYTGYVHGIQGIYYNALTISLYQSLRNCILHLPSRGMDWRYALLTKRLEYGMQTKENFIRQVREAVDVLKGEMRCEDIQ